MLDSSSVEISSGRRDDFSQRRAPFWFALSSRVYLQSRLLLVGNLWADCLLALLEGATIEAPGR